jgi:hypothetical protein
VLSWEEYGSKIEERKSTMIESYELGSIELDENNLGWNLLDPGSCYRTNHTKVFIYFLNSPGTTHYEMILDGENLTIVCHGPTGSVILEKAYKGMVHAERKDLCNMIKLSPTKMEQRKRDKLSSSLRYYLSVEMTAKKNTSKSRLPSKR